MAKKVDVDLVKMVLQRNNLDIRQVSQIMSDITDELQAQDQDEEKAPPVKKQFVIALSDPEGRLQGMDIVGWVAQIPEDDPPSAAIERIIRGAYEYNVTPKGRRLPVKSIGEACEVVSARIFKEQNVWVKTKEPVLAVVTDNTVPMDSLKAE